MKVIAWRGTYRNNDAINRKIYNVMFGREGKCILCVDGEIWRKETAWKS